MLRQSAGHGSAQPYALSVVSDRAVHSVGVRRTPAGRYALGSEKRGEQVRSPALSCAQPLPTSSVARAGVRLAGGAGGAPRETPDAPRGQRAPRVPVRAGRRRAARPDLLGHCARPTALSTALSASLERFTVALN